MEVVGVEPRTAEFVEHWKFRVEDEWVRHIKERFWIRLKLS